jgi:hypothetical protein
VISPNATVKEEAKMKNKYLVELVAGMMWLGCQEAARADLSEYISPVSATASSYTVWAGTDYTGPADFAIDGNTWTSWTLNGLGWIEFDMGQEYVMDGIRTTIGGHTTPFNQFDLYIDGLKVLEDGINEVYGSIVYYSFPEVTGQYVTYVTKDMGEWYSNWSEIGEFSVHAVPAPGAALLGAIGLAYSGWGLRRKTT